MVSKSKVKLEAKMLKPIHAQENKIASREKRMLRWPPFGTLDAEDCLGQKAVGSLRE